MAEVKRQLKKSRRRSTAKSNKVQRPRKKPVTNAKNVPAEDAPVAATEERAELSVTLDPMVDGAEQLRRSVNQKVADKADRIANQLTELAAQGSSTCAKFLWEVMGCKKQPSKSSSNRMSEYIDMLESEPECGDPETNSAKQTEGNNA